MTTPHLSSDELDGLLVGSMSAAARTHLGECGSCRALAATDRVVVTALERLPRFSPSPQFVDRVMARVSLVTPARFILGLRVPAGPTTRLAASVAVLLLAGITTSVVWSLGNRHLLAAWGQQAQALVDSWLWLGLRTVVANLTEQPWYGPVRSVLGSPGRLAAAALVGVTAWSAGIFALKRLVALPSHAS